MGLLAPLWLLLLLLGAVILWLHLRRRTRRTLAVSSLHLWRRLAQAAPPAAPQKRPPLEPLLLLQLLILALLALALAQPVVGFLRPAGQVIYVLDASGSMQATDLRPSRLERAKAELQGFLRTHPEGRWLVSLVVADAAPRALAARQPGAADLVPVVASLRGTQGPVRWDRVASLVGALRGREEARIVLLGDGQGEARASLAGLGRFEQRVFADRGANLGFSAIQLTPPAKGFRRTKVKGEIRQFGTEEPSALVEVVFRGEGGAEPVVLTSQKVSLTRTRAASFELFFSLPGPGVVELRLPEDALEADNHAYYVLRKEPRTLRVLHLGPDSPALERALGAVGGLEVVEAKTLPEASHLFDLVVVDRTPLEASPKTSTLWIGTHPTASKGRLTDTYLSGWSDDHPLCEGVDWAGLEVRAARDFPRQRGAEVLAEASGRPLVQALTTPYGRQVTLAFDPAQSNWPDSPGFPLFIHNLVRWIDPSVGTALEPGCRAGEVCPLDPRLLAGEWQLFDPQGRPLPLETAFVAEGQQRWLPRGLEGLFRPEQSGVYTLAAGGLRRSIAVNAFGGESDIRAGQQGAGAAQAEAPPKPLWVWLLLLAAGLLLLEAVLAGRLEGVGIKTLWRDNPLAGRRRRALLLQGSSALAVLAALLPLQLALPSNRLTAVLLLDRPELHTGRSSGAVQTALERRQGHTVWLGAHPTVADPEDPRPPDPPDLGSDLEAALSLAAALVPPQGRGRVALVSDGLQTRGRAVEAVAPLARRGIAVDVLPVGGIPEGEVFVEQFASPALVRAGDRVVLQALVYSERDTAATALIARQNRPWVRRPLRLLSGRNRIEIPVREAQPGNYRYDLEISSPQDTFAQNNRRAVSLAVRPRPRVALLALEAAPAGLLKRALRIQGVEAEVVPPADAPKNLEGWAGYEAAVLMNLPATRLSTEQQSALETWVREQGGGLLILGGANSFGPGGYYRTALDRLSPLSSKIPQEAPKVAMLFLLDKSGSMNQPTGEGNTRRVEIAVGAILEAVRQFHPESLAGVVAFDTQAEAVVPLQSVQNLGVFEERLSSVQTGGGTSLLPALEAAYAQMRGVGSLARHVVLLSDGLSDLGDFEAVVGRMAREDITLSTVAIGEGADVALVERLARLGRGAAHVTTDWQALPGILAQEALLLSSTPVKRKDFAPQWTAADRGLLEGWPSALPALGGYVLTTAKPAARLHLVGPEQAPLLASWRVGLGQVVAFASQGIGAWAGGWTALPQFPQMWGQVIHQILKPTAQAGLNLQTRYRGDELELGLEAINPDATPQTGLLLRAKLNQQTFTLQEQTPGRYAASIIPKPAEGYVLEVSSNADPPQTASARVLPAAATRYAFAEGSDLLLGISQATGGKVLLSADRLFAESAPLHWETRPAWPLLVLLSVLLFLAGLWVRYAPVGRAGRSRQTSSVGLNS